jgi:hypothetical protein
MLKDFKKVIRKITHFQDYISHFKTEIKLSVKKYPNVKFLGDGIFKQEVIFWEGKGKISMVS